MFSNFKTHWRCVNRISKHYREKIRRQYGIPYYSMRLFALPHHEAYLSEPCLNCHRNLWHYEIQRTLLVVSMTHHRTLCQRPVNAAALCLYSIVDVVSSVCSNWTLYCACLYTCKLLLPHTHTHLPTHLPKGSVLWVMRHSWAYVQRPVT